jgi:hypothetical protein
MLVSSRVIRFPQTKIRVFSRWRGGGGSGGLYVHGCWSIHAALNHGYHISTAGTREFLKQRSRVLTLRRCIVVLNRGGDFSAKIGG